MPRFVVLVTLYFGVILIVSIFYFMVPMPLFLVGLTTVVFFFILFWGSLRIDSNLFLKAKCKGVNQNAVAITFDDGPLPENTERILNILKDKNVKASFFFIGNRAQENPQIVKRTFAEGHVIGGHSFWHRWDFGFQSSEKVAVEISQTNDSLYSVLGVRPRFFRPPFGVTNPAIAKAVTKSKVMVIGWSLRSLDTVIRKKERLLSRVQKIEPGDIILFHDYCANTIEILPQFIEGIQARGITLTTVEKLLNERAYE